MYYFIVNPNARSGRGQYVWKQVKNKLDKQGIVYEVYFTKHIGHATLIARMLTEYDDTFKIVVAMGGDGTVNEVMEGIIGHPEALFGYIPIGSGNDFARGLGIPFEWEKALACILSEHKTEWVWPLRITYKENGQQMRHGAGSMGIGFDAAVCSGVNHSKIKDWLNKAGLGKLAYTAIAVKQIFTVSRRSVRMRIDGEEIRTYKNVMFACVLKGAYEGGGFKFCPEGNLMEPELNVCVVSGIPRIKCLLVLPFAFKGMHIRFKGVDVFKCRKIEMAVSGKWPLHMDGEVPAETKRVRVELERPAVQIIRQSPMEK